MYKKRKAIVIIFLTSVLLSIALFVSTFESTETQDQTTNLILSDNITISPWHNEADDNYYYFLPSYADVEDLHFSAGNTSGQKTKLLKSENVSTIFINTATGSMKSILKSKKYREAAEITVIDENGNTVFSENNSRISGRGNYTWDNAEKKPFALLFSEPTSILGMAPSSKWALLSNPYDRSGIRNAIALDTAKNVGMDLTPEYKYVDLYLNGNYNGLYMLCQSPETFYERSDISRDNLFLFTAELPIRKKDADFPIISPLSQSLIDVRLPEVIRNEEKETAEKIISRIDYSVTTERNDIGDILDLDSWTKKYLIDEVFENYDSGLASSYFYVSDPDSGSKVYAGPIWDYDNIIGKTLETNNPEIMYAMNEYRSKSEKILWYHDLYTNPIFYNEMVNTFENSFVPQLEALIETDIETLLSSTQEARRNNDLRWNIDSSDSYDYLTNYLSKRLDFLKRTWLENE
ncbi:CotH kinase family protein [Butyrivibrio sp. WCD3002]|uniref:CotH kinase family protein n=1 Tax=Butyrivibrio sp. WCD3002 TaxID=1280676 RepID=UPI0003F7BD95|nr:CotH kinase family protein [Butyrivibrio sp. WCD3002]